MATKIMLNRMPLLAKTSSKGMPDGFPVNANERLVATDNTQATTAL